MKLKSKVTTAQTNKSIEFKGHLLANDRFVTHSLKFFQIREIVVDFIIYDPWFVCFAEKPDGKMTSSGTLLFYYSF